MHISSEHTVPSWKSLKLRGRKPTFSIYKGAVYPKRGTSGAGSAAINFRSFTSTPEGDFSHTWLGRLLEHQLCCTCMAVYLNRGALIPFRSASMAPTS